MNEYLIRLVRQILAVYSDGISKVRLAKLAYLVHKGLVQNDEEKTDSLAFIRMPLGPVPVGFNQIGSSDGIKIYEESIGLTYNRQTYRLENTVEEPNKVIHMIVKNLATYSTSDLVQYTHEEPSWLENVNGNEYYIDENDLKRNLPIKNWTKLKGEIDDQKLQALLINGMMDDIVDESTALEYPVRE